ncbi:MAG: hypothetical protein KGL68_17810 [Burkholderiales bacterium]|nr:hypothetical protein [Burkholderiales bacterium]
MSLYASLDHSLVDIGSPAKLDFAGPVSLMAWVRPGATDGSSWRCEQEQAFPPRFGASAVVLGGRMYVLGGVEAGASTPADMHGSDDGGTWTPVAPTSPWAGREQQGGSVVGGRIVICGGVTRPANPPRDLDDVWTFTPL